MERSGAVDSHIVTREAADLRRDADRRVPILSAIGRHGHIAPADSGRTVIGYVYRSRRRDGNIGETVLSFDDQYRRPPGEAAIR